MVNKWMDGWCVNLRPTKELSKCKMSLTMNGKEYISSLGDVVIEYISYNSFCDDDIHSLQNNTFFLFHPFL